MFTSELPYVEEIDLVYDIEDDERYKVFGDVILYDEELNIIHKMTMESVIDAYDDWNAMNKAYDVWSNLFKDWSGPIDIDDIWCEEA